MTIPRTTIAEKASQLDIIMLTRTYALVEGTHDTYGIWLDIMTCSCRAAIYGRACSHVLAAKRAREKARPLSLRFPIDPYSEPGWHILRDGTGAELGRYRTYLAAETAREGRHNG